MICQVLVQFGDIVATSLPALYKTRTVRRQRAPVRGPYCDRAQKSWPQISSAQKMCSPRRLVALVIKFSLALQTLAMPLRCLADSLPDVLAPYAWWLDNKKSSNAW